MPKKILKEIENTWIATPAAVRIVLIIVIAINSTSLASLAENIIKWKGFFLTGITFYRSFFSPIISAFNDYLNINLEQWRLDFITIYYLIIGTDSRSLKIFQKFNTPKKSDWMFVVSYLAIIPTFFLLDQWNAILRHSALALMAVLLMFPVISAIVFIYYGSRLTSILNREEDEGLPQSIRNVLKIFSKLKSGSLRFFLNIIIMITLVCIAAAVNIGIRG